MPSIKSHHDNPSAEVTNNNNQVIVKYDGMYPKTNTITSNNNNLNTSVSTNNMTPSKCVVDKFVNVASGKEKDVVRNYHFEGTPFASSKKKRRKHHSSNSNNGLVMVNRILLTVVYKMVVNTQRRHYPASNNTYLHCT